MCFMNGLKEASKLDVPSEVKVHKMINDTPDSLTIGTPGKGGEIKIYTDFKDWEGTKKKIDEALVAREYTAVLVKAQNKKMGLE